MLAVVVPYDPSRARDLAGAVAQIVPVLLLGALAVPLLQRRDETEEPPKRRAAGHLIATVVVIGLSVLTEYAALYGIYYRLVPHDVHLLVSVFALTGLAAAIRVLMPIVEHYSDVLAVRQRLLWLGIGLGAVAVFIGALLGTMS